MNRNLLSKGLLFLAGGTIGSVATWYLTKSKYEKTMKDKNEEIVFLRDRYSESKSCEKAENKLVKDFQDDIEETTDEISVDRLRDKVQELGYINSQVINEEIREREDKEDMKKYHVIPPEETWEQDYPMITLTYYERDNVLADERDKIIANIDELVGDDFASHFGEYEENSVYIQNDELKVCYEILKDNGSYY